jgi:hypothetical protein
LEIEHRKSGDSSLLNIFELRGRPSVDRLQEVVEMEHPKKFLESKKTPIPIFREHSGAQQPLVDEK